MNPYLLVCDIETMISWYEDFLSFECVYRDKIKKTNFATLERKGDRIYLARDPEMDSYASNVFIIEVTDIEASLSEVEAKGCIVITDIEDGFWGKSQFAIKDYEDNKIVFIQK